MGRNYSNKNLTNLELGNIEFYLNEGKNISEIGRFINKDESTIILPILVLLENVLIV